MNVNAKCWYNNNLCTHCFIQLFHRLLNHTTNSISAFFILQSKNDQSAETGQLSLWIKIHICIATEGHIESESLTGTLPHPPNPMKHILCEPKFELRIFKSKQ